MVGEPLDQNTEILIASPWKEFISKNKNLLYQKNPFYSIIGKVEIEKREREREREIIVRER